MDQVVFAHVPHRRDKAAIVLELVKPSVAIRVILHRSAGKRSTFRCQVIDAETLTPVLDSTPCTESSYVLLRNLLFSKHKDAVDYRFQILVE